MTDELLLIHALFILACAGGSYWYGFENGRKEGRTDVVADFLEHNLVTESQLKRHYNISE